MGHVMIKFSIKFLDFNDWSQLLYIIFGMIEAHLKGHFEWFLLNQWINFSAFILFKSAIFMSLSGSDLEENNLHVPYVIICNNY